MNCEIYALLGAGGMGEVDRAYDPGSERQVSDQGFASSGSARLEHLRRFEDEAQAAAAPNHPNIFVSLGLACSKVRRTLYRSCWKVILFGRS